ncbi:uncharacterized protein V6R79_017769 [Siganus canaliculatus]
MEEEKKKKKLLLDICLFMEFYLTTHKHTKLNSSSHFCECVFEAGLLRAARSAGAESDLYGRTECEQRVSDEFIRPPVERERYVNRSSASSVRLLGSVSGAGPLQKTDPADGLEKGLSGGDEAELHLDPTFRPNNLQHKV